MLGNKWALRITFVSALLAFAVILLGATTRLKEAGLGCPDWPGCYGQLIVPHQPISSVFAGQKLNSEKAWTEMIHRYAVAILALLSFTAVILILQQRKLPHQPVNIAFIFLILLFFQGLLGKWTVTLRLHPLVVMSHLLGGLTLLSVLWMLILRLTPIFRDYPSNQEKKLRLLAALGLFIIVLQITLGGWTSSNYAAFVCPDFPGCQGHWWPRMNFSEGFNVWLDANRNFEGGLLSIDARTAIQVSHRIGALITALYLIFLAWRLRKISKKKILRVISLLLLIFLTLQITLGILNVIWLLPLSIAVAHNGVAALLLLTLLSLNLYLNQKAIS
ncbi:MAG: COX15/CtaA family protein [Pseudomonadota bacterium]